MTEDEIKNMPAGREMDEAIARDVMDLVPCGAWRSEYGGSGLAMLGKGEIHMLDEILCKHDADQGCYPTGNPSEYSTNISAAWEVVERMEELEYWTETYRRWGYCEGRYQPVHFVHMLYQGKDTPKGNAYASDISSLPLAVCRAALIAAMYRKRSE